MCVLRHPEEAPAEKEVEDKEDEVKEDEEKNNDVKEDDVKEEKEKENVKEDEVKLEGNPEFDITEMMEVKMKTENLDVEMKEDGEEELFKEEEEDGEIDVELADPKETVGQGVYLESTIVQKTKYLGRVLTHQIEDEYVENERIEHPVVVYVVVEANKLLSKEEKEYLHLLEKKNTLLERRPEAKKRTKEENTQLKKIFNRLRKISGRTNVKHLSNPRKNKKEVQQEKVKRMAADRKRKSRGNMSVEEKEKEREKDKLRKRKLN